jgi:hypothetical protein
MQSVCSIPCAQKVTEQNRVKKAEKVARAKTKVARENLKTLSDHRADTQKLFNTYIRTRDMHRPCPTCRQSPYQGKRDASHYRSRAAAPQLAYNFLQVWAACVQCNRSKSGNVVEFRIFLARTLTASQLEAIEYNNERAGYTVEYLKRLQGLLKRRIKHYKRLRAVA